MTGLLSVETKPRSDSCTASTVQGTALVNVPPLYRYFVIKVQLLDVASIVPLFKGPLPLSTKPLFKFKSWRGFNLFKCLDLKCYAFDVSFVF